VLEIIIRKPFRIVIGFVSLSLFLSITSLNGQDAKAFDLAAKALEEGDLTTAIQDLEQIASTDKVSKELFANLGKAYYLNDEIGKSVLAYERALKLAPSDSDINTALTNVRQDLAIRLIEVPDFILVTAERSFAQSLSPTGWVVIQVLVGLLALGCLFLLWFKPDVRMERKILWIALIASAVLFLLTFLLSYQSRSLRHSHDTGVVMVESTAIYQAPAHFLPQVGNEKGLQQ